MRLKRMTFRASVEATSDPTAPVRLKWGDLAFDMSIEEATRICAQIRGAIRQLGGLDGDA